MNPHFWLKNPKPNLVHRSLGEGGFQAIVIQGVIKTNPHFWPKNPKANFLDAQNEPNSFKINEQCLSGGLSIVATAKMEAKAKTETMNNPVRQKECRI